MRLNAFSMILVWVMGLIVIAEKSSLAQQKVPTYVIKFGHLQPLTDPWHLGALKFKEVVEKKSEGRLKVEIYPASQLGSEREQMEGVKIGTQEITTNSPGMLATIFPEVGVFDLPYLFRNQEHLHKVLEGPIGRGVMNRMQKGVGMFPLALWDRGPRHLTSKKPVYTPADVKGLKIRVPEIRIYLAIWRALGAKPTPMAFAELYTGLATGTVDAQENPLEVIWSNKFYEVQSHLVLTGHMRAVLWVMMNDRFFRNLPPDLQKVVTEAAKESEPYTNDIVTKAQEEILANLKTKGMKVIQPDLNAFANATKDVYVEFVGPKSFSKELYWEIKNYK
jgi:tripartite ATP-independent transporter DctP family solute receptor